MEQKLKKIKELLEKSIDDSTKKDLYIGQALGLLDSLIIDTNIYYFEEFLKLFFNKVSFNKNFILLKVLNFS